MTEEVKSELGQENFVEEQIKQQENDSLNSNPLYKENGFLQDQDKEVVIEETYEEVKQEGSNGIEQVIENKVVEKQEPIGVSNELNGNSTGKRKFEENIIEDQQDISKQLKMDNNTTSVNNNIAQEGVDQITETLTCPSNMVGKLIGRQGETISIIQGYSNCKVQVHHKESGEPKKVSVSGTREGFEKVKEIIHKVLYEDKSLTDEKREIECPADLVGKVIGKAGDTIKALQVASGAKIHVNQDSTPKKINISGRLDHVEVAAAMIENLITSENVTVQTVINNHARMVKITETCSKSFVGKIIGKGGANIKELNRKTRARIQIDQTSEPCKITIQGPQKAAQAAQQEIKEIISSLQMPQQGGQGFGGLGGQQFVAQPFNAFTQQAYAAQMPYAQPAQSMGAYSQYYGQPNMMGQYGGQPQGGQGMGAGAAGVWQELKDQNGRSYYYNRLTNQSQWEKPVELM